MLPSRGRPGLTLLMSVERELTPLDLLRVAQAGTGVRSAPPVLKRLRAIHHEAARLLVSGKNCVEVAFLVGYTPQRVRDLQGKDPAFQELVAYYSDQRTQITITESDRAQKKMAEIFDLASDELLDRLEDPAKVAAMPTSEIRQIISTAGDRSVAPVKTAVPPQNAPTHITFNMGPRELTPRDPISKTIDQDGKVLIGNPSESDVQDQ